jgi:hypothetical protein
MGEHLVDEAEDDGMRRREPAGHASRGRRRSSTIGERRLYASSATRNQRLERRLMPPGRPLHVLADTILGKEILGADDAVGAHALVSGAQQDPCHLVMTPFALDA